MAFHRSLRLSLFPLLFSDWTISIALMLTWPIYPRQVESVLKSPLLAFSFHFMPLNAVISIFICNNSFPWYFLFSKTSSSPFLLVLYIIAALNALPVSSNISLLTKSPYWTPCPVPVPQRPNFLVSVHAFEFLIENQALKNMLQYLQSHVSLPLGLLLPFLSLRCLSSANSYDTFIPCHL